MNAISLLIKPTSSLCNLRCKYCFYEDEANNRSQHSMGIMSDALAQKLIAQTFAAIGSEGSVSFTFQGGEPTVAGLPFFRRFVTTVSQQRPKGVQVQFAIQTNGILLDTEWAAFLKENNFLVGLSVDGIRSVHDTLRVDPAGQGTWRRVLQARSLLEKHSIPYNALCVVTGPCAERPEQIYKGMKLLGTRYFQFIACLDPIGQEKGRQLWSLTPEQYGRFLCRIFDLWYGDWVSGNYYSVRLFEDYVHILLGDHASTCATCGKCGSYLVVEADGSVYPCDFFVLDDWRIGTLHDACVSKLIESEKVNSFLRWGTEKPAECASCPYGAICNGGCKNDWITDKQGVHNYFCSAFKTLLDYALPRLQEIARAELRARGR